MRLSILKGNERKLARSAAILVVGGLAAGCSSQVDRFSESIFTGSSYSHGARTASLSQQPYPGDVKSSLDGTPTGSIGDRVVRPDVPVGEGGMNSGNTQTPTYNAPVRNAPVGGVQRGNITSAPLAPVSSSGAPAQSRLAPVSSTMSQPRRPADASVTTAPAASAEPRKAGWSGQGGAKVTVRPGETVYNLSKRFGVPADAILAANGLSSGSALQAGSTITIPTYAYSESAPGSFPDADPRVAKASPTPEKQPSNSAAGDKLAVMPRSDGAQREEQAADGQAPKVSGDVYTVASGDTLYGISRKTGVSVASIKEANGLTDGYLRVGQQLKLSGKAPSAQQTASAKPEAAEEPKTASTSDANAGKEEKVAAYTPPSKSETSDKSGSVADKAKDQDEQEEASLPPDSTGIGRLRWPVRGRIISGFGSVGAAGDGIDIAVPEGTPVKAAENGVVIYAGDGLKEFGKTVLVRHENGLVTVYGYTSDIKVSRGDTVKRGEVIASSGMSGSADRPKLHFEVRKDAAPVDPTKFLD